MKTMFLAAAIALTSIAATVPDVQAASTTVTIGPNGVKVKERDYRRRHHQEVCRVKTVRTYRNHRLVIRKVRVCR